MQKRQTRSVTARRRKDNKGRGQVTIFIADDLWLWAKRKSLDLGTNNSTLVECLLLMLKGDSDLETSLRVYIEDIVGKREG